MVLKLGPNGDFAGECFCLKLFSGVRARSLLERESLKSNSKRSNPTPIGPLVQDMIPTYQEKYDYVIFNRVPKVIT